jgi:hypothetical protein
MERQRLLVPADLAAGLDSNQANVAAVALCYCTASCFGSVWLQCLGSWQKAQPRIQITIVVVCTAIPCNSKKLCGMAVPFACCLAAGFRQWVFYW